MNSISYNERPILFITSHRQFGPMIVPWEVGRDTSGWLTLQNRLSREISPDTTTENADVLREIISLSQTFNDIEIHRRFARKGVSVKDFLKGFPEELLLLQIRPFIDRQMDKMFRLAIQHDIPVFVHDGSPRIYPETRLLPDANPAEPWFCFTKTHEGSNYVLEIYQEDQKINLKAPGNRIICYNPCWVKTGNRLLHFPEGFDGKKIEPFLKKRSSSFPLRLKRSTSGRSFSKP